MIFFQMYFDGYVGCSTVLPDGITSYEFQTTKMVENQHLSPASLANLTKLVF